MKIAPEEIQLAAMYFTMSNMAILELVPHGCKDIRQAYNHTTGIVEMETGTSCDPEFKSWLKEVKKAKKGDYVFEEWEKVKTNWNSKGN